MPRRLARVQLRSVERWLDEGWSPWRIGYGLVGLVATSVSVYGYARQAHHPGAIWWLLAALSVVTTWALGEMFRWRAKYRRLLASHRVAVPQREMASKEGQTLRRLRKLFGDGRALLIDVAAFAEPNMAIPYNIPGKIARWEAEASDALEDRGDLRVKFEAAPVHDAVVPTSGAACDRIEYQLKVLRRAIGDPSLKISVDRQPARRARIRVLGSGPFE